MILYQMNLYMNLKSRRKLCNNKFISIHFKDVKWLGYDDINKGIKNYTNQIPIYACLSYGITEGVIGGRL